MAQQRRTIEQELEGDSEEDEAQQHNFQYDSLSYFDNDRNDYQLQGFRSDQDPRRQLYRQDSAMPYLRPELSYQFSNANLGNLGETQISNGARINQGAFVSFENEEIQINDENFTLYSNNSLKVIPENLLQRGKEGDQEFQLLGQVREEDQVVLREQEQQARIQEIENLSKKEESSIVSNLEEWMGVSKNNKRLRMLLRSTKNDLLTEKSMNKKQKQYHTLLSDRAVKKMRKLISQDQLLIDASKERDKLYNHQTEIQSQITQELLLTKQKLREKINMLELSEVELVVCKSQLIDKDMKINEITQQLNQFQTSTSQQSLNKDVTQQQQVIEGEQKIIEETQAIQQQDVINGNEWKKLYSEMYLRMMKLQEENQQNQIKIQKLQEKEEIAQIIETKYNCVKDELAMVKESNQKLSALIVDHQQQGQILREKVQMVKKIEQENGRLQEDLEVKTKIIQDKERLLIEQEIIHQIKIDQLNQKNKQQEEAMNQEEKELINKLKNHMEEENTLRDKDRQLIKNLLGWDIIETSEKKLKLTSPNGGEVEAIINESGEIDFPDKEKLLENARELYSMLEDQNNALPIFGSCVENFWLISAVQLKSYLDEQLQNQDEQSVDNIDTLIVEEESDDDDENHRQYLEKKFNSQGDKNRESFEEFNDEEGQDEQEGEDNQNENESNKSISSSSKQQEGNEYQEQIEEIEN